MGLGCLVAREAVERDPGPRGQAASPLEGWGAAALERLALRAAEAGDHGFGRRAVRRCSPRRSDSPAWPISSSAIRAHTPVLRCGSRHVGVDMRLRKGLNALAVDAHDLVAGLGAFHAGRMAVTTDQHAAFDHVHAHRGPAYSWSASSSVRTRWCGRLAAAKNFVSSPVVRQRVGRVHDLGQCLRYSASQSRPGTRSKLAKLYLASDQSRDR